MWKPKLKLYKSSRASTPARQDRPRQAWAIPTIYIFKTWGASRLYYWEKPSRKQQHNPSWLICKRISEEGKEKNSQFTYSLLHFYSYFSVMWSGACPEMPFGLSSTFITIEDHRVCRGCSSMRMMLVMIMMHGCVVRVWMLMVAVMVCMWMMCCPRRRCWLHAESKASIKVLRETPHDAHIDAYAHLVVFCSSPNAYFT